MKTSRRFLSVLLAILMVVSVMLVSATATVSAATASISYSFTKSDAGFAQGTITVTPTTGNFGTYYLYWADDTKALEGYRALGSLNITSGSGKLTMPAQTAIPADATQVIAFKATSEPTSANRTVAKASATYAIPESRQLSFTSEDALYTFGAVSDPQIANEASRYINDETHWRAALETMAQRGVDFMVSSGDTVNDQEGNKTYAAEYKTYQKILADSSYTNPIYETIGNHELWANPSIIGIPSYIKGTGLDSNADTLKSGKPYYEITEPTTGDHFIFMALEGPFRTNEGTQFSTAQLDWLEGLLKKYSTDGKNIFIIEHANVAGWGSGDKLTAPYYYDLGLVKTNSDVQRFIKLMETYKECVIITGHTHLELSAQYNYSDNSGTSAVMMHNSAIGGVRRLVNGSVDRSDVLGLSEGYIVEVYEDCIIFNGTNLYYNEIMPQCSYIIPFDTQATDNPTNPDSTDPTDTDPTDSVSTTTKATESEITTTEPAETLPTGYYLVGDLGGKNLWGVETLSADRLLVKNPAVAGEYYLKWTFFGGDELKVAHYNGKSFDTWYNNLDNNYKIGANSDKVGPGTIYFNPNGNSDWSYTYLTVQADPKNPTTTPTEPITTKATDPTETSTATTATETQPTEPEVYLYGDADLSGKVTIKDATAVQKHSANMIALEGKAFTQANVSGDKTVNVRDATYIQKFVASMIDSFPVNEKIAPVGAATFAQTLTEVKSDLELYYTYSSYDQFMALKKAYLGYKSASLTGAQQATAIAEMESLQDDLYEIVEVVENLATPEIGEITVYFTNNKNWSTVKAYAWGTGGTMSSWPGSSMTYVKTNSMGEKIYSITFDYNNYQNIIFNDGSKQTVDIALSGETGIGYYISGESSGKYTCSTYTYS